MTWTLRAWEPTDEAFLHEMLFAALYVPEGADPLPDSILDEPAIAHYIDGFGRRDGDLGLVASVGGEPAGACWLRRFPALDPGYGWVAADVPELSIALRDGARGRGMGTALIEAMLESASERGIGSVSLSVDARSPALRLYERLGFQPVGQADGSVTMVRSCSQVERVPSTEDPAQRCL